MQNQDDFLCLQQVNRPVTEVHIPGEHDQVAKMFVLIVPLDQTVEPTFENPAGQSTAGEREEENLE